MAPLEDFRNFRDPRTYFYSGTVSGTKNYSYPNYTFGVGTFLRQAGVDGGGGNVVPPVRTDVVRSPPPRPSRIQTSVSINSLRPGPFDVLLPLHLP